MSRQAGRVTGLAGQEAAVTGSGYVPIIVPIVAFFAMAFWLRMVFYADSHPRYRHGQPTGAAPPEGAATEQHRAALRAPGPAGPREHERIDEDTRAGALR